MYFSFANVFFPSKFPHIRQRLSRFVQCGSRKDMQANLTIKLLYETTQEKAHTKKSVNLILENATPKVKTEVYFELLVTNFYAQIFCSCHSKFVKIISILMHRIAITVFVSLSDCKEQIKKAILIWTPALVAIFIKTISDVFAHASYKCPVYSCFE